MSSNFPLKTLLKNRIKNFFANQFESANQKLLFGVSLGYSGALNCKSAFALPCHECGSQPQSLNPLVLHTKIAIFQDSEINGLKMNLQSIKVRFDSDRFRKDLMNCDNIPVLKLDAVIPCILKADANISRCNACVEFIRISSAIRYLNS